MQSFATKLRRFLVSEDGLTTVEFALGCAMTVAMGYIAYRMLRNGLF
jgi:Flp pilus assembly pilin Flp